VGAQCCRQCGIDGFGCFGSGTIGALPAYSHEALLDGRSYTRGRTRLLQGHQLDPSTSIQSMQPTCAAGAESTAPVEHQHTCSHRHLMPFGHTNRKISWALSPIN
jgi:hypothetical protein